MQWQIDFLDSIHGTRIGVVGDIMLDRYLYGHIDRISPEAPVPVVLLESDEERLGGAGNVALNLAQLGCKATLFGITGQDANSDRVRTLASENQIDASGIVQVHNRPTTIKTRVIAGQQHVLRVDAENGSDISSETQVALVERIRQFLQNDNPDALILQDYNKGVLTKELIEEVLKLSAETGTPVIVDPKERNFLEYRGVAVFKPNLRELQVGTPFEIGHTRDDLVKASAFLRKHLNHNWSCFTLGEHGIFIDDGSSAEVYPTDPRDVVDVCGAGDAVVCILTLGYINGLNSGQLAAMANMAGGLVCEHVGVTALTQEMLRAECRL